MRRTLVLLTAATSLVLGVAGPAAAVPPSATFDHDCRVTAEQCHPGKHSGWPEEQTVPERRNVGG